MPTSQPDGFLAKPPAGSSRAVLVLHPWWGVNETIKAVCQQLARAGFVAFAPDLYHGKIARTIAEAEALSNALDDNQARRDALAAAQYLCRRRGVAQNGLAVIGFSLGAYFALDLSVADAAHVRKVVLFYGTGPGDFRRARASYLGHCAHNDPYESRAGVASAAAHAPCLSLAGAPTGL